MTLWFVNPWPDAALGRRLGKHNIAWSQCAPPILWLSAQGFADAKRAASKWCGAAGVRLVRPNTFPHITKLSPAAADSELLDTMNHASAQGDSRGQAGLGLEARKNSRDSHCKARLQVWVGSARRLRIRATALTIVRLNDQL
jgi:hypothetical protein